MMGWLDAGRSKPAGIARWIEQHAPAIGVVIALGALFFTWRATAAGRDAAQATRDQVVLQSRPYLDVGVKGLKFAYDDGVRAVSTRKTVIDLNVSGDRIYEAVALRNLGPGLAVVRHWRVGAYGPVSHAPYQPPTKSIERAWSVPAGDEVVLHVNKVTSEPADLLFAAAVRNHEDVIVEVFYSDFDDRQRYKLSLVLRSVGPPPPRPPRWTFGFVSTSKSWGA